MLDDVLADHGNVVVGFDWRVDRVQTSSRGDLSDTAVVMLRIQYRNGDETDSVSLQLTEAVVQALGEFCGQFWTASEDGTDKPNSERSST